MPEDESQVSRRDTTAARTRAVALAVDHGDTLVGGTRRDLLELASALRCEIVAGGGVLPMTVAWRVGTAHHYRGEYPTALAYFQAAAADPDPHPVDRARFLAGHASVLWAQGNSEDGRRIAEEAMAAAVASGDDGAIGVAWVANGLVQAHAGDRTANLLCYERALEHAERAGDAITVVRVRNNLGSRHVEAGRFRQALAELDHAVAVAEDHAVGLASAMVSVNRAEALLGLGRLDEAVGEIAIATDQFRRAEAAHLLAFALLLEADTHRVRGNATRAHAKFLEAAERAETAGNAQVLGPALAGLAETTVTDDPAAAHAHAKQALDQPHTVGDVVALRAAGWVAIAQGDHEAAEMWADRALAEAGRRDQLAELADALELRALTRWSSTGDVHDALGILAEAADAWREVGSAIRTAVNRIVVARLSGDRGAEAAGRQALQALGVRADADRIAGPLQVLGAATAPEVAIRTFGTFAVSVSGGAPVPAPAWPSRKSRQLVQLLAARRGRAMSRAAIAELLWPGVRDTSGRLSVALSTARAVLDPERRHSADRYLASDRSHARLDPTTVSIDIVEFERLAHAALDAVRSGSADAVSLLQAAASLHPAPFLADEAVDDWADEIRDDLLRLAIDVKRTLAECLIADEETEQAVGWLMAVIADDPYDEPSHCRLIQVLAGARRHGEARRAYRAYAARMAELEVEPASLDEITG